MGAPVCTFILGAKPRRGTKRGSRVPARCEPSQPIGGDRWPWFLLLRYRQSLIAQLPHTAICNRRHSLEQQLCRGLLLSLDRLLAHELAMTQQLTAASLGVRREDVAEAAGKLQRLNRISYARGHIVALKRIAN